MSPPGLFGLPAGTPADDSCMDAVLLRGGDFDGLQVWLTGNKPVLCPLHHLEVGQSVARERRVAFLEQHPDSCAGYERTRESEGRFTVYRAVSVTDMPATDLCRHSINLSRLRRGLPPKWPTAR